MSKPTPVQLLAFIKETFDMDELETLCFQLYVPFDDLAGQTREAKARELVEFMQRVGRTNDLIATLAHERSDAWEQQFGSDELEIVQRAATQKPGRRNPNQIFVSHAHQDAEIAQRLAADLREAGYDIWIAPDSIQPGERWVDAINRALKESGVFLLVSTPNAVASQWVQDETSYAIELAVKEGVRFIRLDVTEAEVPPMWSVRQHIPFHGGYDEGLQRLLAALASYADVKSIEATVGASRKPPKPTKSMARDAVTQADPGLTVPAKPQQHGEVPAVGTAATSTSLSKSSATVANGLRQLPRWSYWVGGLAILAIMAAVVVYNSGWLDNQSPSQTVEVATIDSEMADAFASLAPPITTQPLGQATETRIVTLPSGIDVTQVQVPAGSYLMGANWDSQVDVIPPHSVNLTNYWIDRTEVTNGQYYSCVQEGTCDPAMENDEYAQPEFADYPIVLVNWFDANRFCRWAGGSLPTEAEWEIAAKGWDILTEPFGGTLPPEFANFDDDVGNPVPVGSYPAGTSWVGAQDMLGNVWEWVADWYDSEYYAIAPLQDPTGPETGERRLVRGGSYSQSGYYTNSVFRNPSPPGEYFYDFGFRCAGDSATPAASKP